MSVSVVDSSDRAETSVVSLSGRNGMYEPFYPDIVADQLRRAKDGLHPLIAHIVSLPGRAGDVNAMLKIAANNDSVIGSVLEIRRATEDKLPPGSLRFDEHMQMAMKSVEGPIAVVRHEAMTDQQRELVLCYQQVIGIVASVEEAIAALLNNVYKVDGE